MRWAGPVARMGRRGMHLGYWWENQKEKRPLERPRRRCVGNTKMHLRVTRWGVMDWTDLA
jgi:hypothetical protein